jgi:flagellum-specific ATP synthase
MVKFPVPSLNLSGLVAGMAAASTLRPEGRVYEVTGLTVKSVGPYASIGDMVWIEGGEAHGARRRVACEVVGFRDQFVLLMPVERMEGIRPGARVIREGRMTVSAGYSLRGRVLDGLGRPMDGRPPAAELVPVDIDRAAPHPLQRERLNVPFVTGIRAIDGLLTCARGQRIGIFSGSGVGKSVLLGSLARNSSATVNVIALIGERGREVRDFIETCLGPEGLARSVVVTVGCDASPVLRVKGAQTAMAIAEFFRDHGENVLFLMDSVTRCAMAQREIGLAVGEPPTTKGYPPSVFGVLARLLERSGTSDKGSITAMFTVLVEADDMNDPIADSVRAILDGHIVLSRELAAFNHYPAIDVLPSVSRTMNSVVSASHRQSAGRVRALLAAYRKAEDLINVGAYVGGSNRRIDEAIQKIEAINEFLRQPQGEAAAWDEMLRRLGEIAA